MIAISLSQWGYNLFVASTIRITQHVRLQKDSRCRSTTTCCLTGLSAKRSSRAVANLVSRSSADSSERVATRSKDIRLSSIPSYLSAWGKMYKGTYTFSDFLQRLVFPSDNQQSRTILIRQIPHVFRKLLKPDSSICSILPLLLRTPSL
jgi:hypothetical protein